MVLFTVIIGVILFLIGSSFSNNQSLSKFARPFKIGAVIAIVIGLMSSMFKQIDAGKVGVQSLYGNVQPDILESGLHVINPLLDITDFDIQTQNYTMASSPS